MKIAIVLPSLKYLGPVIVMENVIKSLKNKCEFIIISLRKNSESDLERFRDFNVYEIGMKKFPSFNTKLKIKKIINKEKPDLVHANSFWPTILCGKLKIKKIVTIHNNPFCDYVFEYGNKIGKVMAKNFEKSLKNYDKVVCISKYIQKIFKNYNSVLIYNSVEDVKSKNLKLEITKESDSLILYTVSVLNKCKNVIRMIDIMKNVTKRDKNIKLYIIGDGEQKNDIVEKINKFNLNTNVFLLGARDKYFIKSFSSYCDCFLFTSQNEGFGMVLAEALRDEKFICCSNIEVADEIINKNVDGCICKSNSEFEKYILKLNTKKQKINHQLISEKNREEYLKKYTLKNFQDNYYNVYNDVIKGVSNEKNR